MWVRSTLIAAVGCSYIGFAIPGIYTTYSRQKAVQSIKKIDGYVGQDWKWRELQQRLGFRSHGGRVLWWPARITNLRLPIILRGRGGERIVPGGTDDERKKAAFSLLAAIGKLESYKIDLARCGLRDESLRLVNWPHVSVLNLDHNPVNGAFLREASDLRQIWRISLRDTLINDEAIDTLIRRAPALKMIDVSDTSVSSEAIAKLIRRTSIRTLLISADQITPAVVKAARETQRPLDYWVVAPDRLLERTGGTDFAVFPGKLSTGYDKLEVSTDGVRIVPALLVTAAQLATIADTF
ncbi:hypothetical protein [Stratiformator vulcanicus]|nr:hypothetical protein [Stratiformator vulcanicus]